MADTVVPITIYDLPYRVLHQPPPLLAGGTQVTVRATCGAPPSDSMVEDLDSIMTAFFMLASTGALAGGGVPPWEATIADRSKVMVEQESVEWQLQGCRVDERAGAILAQLFLLSQEENPIERLEILGSDRSKASQPMRYEPGHSGPYPPVWAKIPFPWSVDGNAYDAAVLYVKFRSRPDSETMSTIEAEIMTWAAATSMGAYGVAGVTPSFCSLIPDDSLTFVDEDLEWAMSKFRAHPGALNGLVNVCAAINHSVAPMTDLRIK